MQRNCSNEYELKKKITQRRKETAGINVIGKNRSCKETAVLNMN